MLPRNYQFLQTEIDELNKWVDKDMMSDFFLGAFYSNNLS